MLFFVVNKCVVMAADAYAWQAFDCKRPGNRTPWTGAGYGASRV